VQLVDHNHILLNTYLDDVHAEVLNAHKQLHSERKVITAKGIKLRYFEEDEERMTFTITEISITN